MLNRKSFLTHSFEEFHQIVFKYRKKIRESSFFNPLDTEEQKTQKIFSVQSEIVTFIKGKYAEIFYETGKIGGDIFEEVGYIMAALSDEIFIILNWDGRDYWKNNLIEKKMFNSNNAGEIIFDKINKVLQDQSIEVAELSIIYFYCLALGFKGAKRSLSDSEAQIQELKEKLYYKMYYKDSKFFKEKQELFPKAHAALFAEKNVLLDNSIGRWKRNLMLIIALYFLIVEIFWNYRMKHLFDILGKYVGG